MIGKNHKRKWSKEQRLVAYLLAILAAFAAILYFVGCAEKQPNPPRRYPLMCDHRALDGSCVLVQDRP